MAKTGYADVQRAVAARLRAAGGHKRTVALAVEAKEQSSVTQILKSPRFQSMAKSLEGRYPGLQRFRAKDETPGMSLLRALQQIGDTTQTAKTARDLGLPANASREQILQVVAEAAPELGAPHELEGVLADVSQVMAEDTLAQRLFEKDAERDKYQPEAKEPSERDRYHAEYEAHRRNTLEEAIRERDARAGREAPLMAQRKARASPSTDLGMDLVMVKAALEGRRPDVDLTAPGAKQYLRERAGFSDEDLGRVQARDELEFTEALIEQRQLQQQQMEEHEASLASTPEEAAGGGSDA
jgi:hypothetical protein